MLERYLPPDSHRLPAAGLDSGPKHACREIYMQTDAAREVKKENKKSPGNSRDALISAHLLSLCARQVHCPSVKPTSRDYQTLVEAVAERLRSGIKNTAVKNVSMKLSMGKKGGKDKPCLFSYL